MKPDILLEQQETIKHMERKNIPQILEYSLL